MAKAPPKRSHKKKDPKAEPKKDDVEIVGGVEVEKAVVDEGKAEAPKKPKGTRGPKSGENAPLFGVFAGADAEFNIEKGELVVKFDAQRKEWPLQKRNCLYACDLMAAHARQLPVARRSASDAKEVDDYSADIVRSKGEVVVRFHESLSVWKLSKRAATRAIGHMRVEARDLPQLKEE